MSLTRVLIEADPCPACAGDGGHWDRSETGGHEEYDAWMECEACHGTSYMIPSSVRSDRPAQPGDTIELAVETSVGCWHGAPVTHRSERVVAVADVTDCRRVKVNERGRLRRVDVLTLADPRPPAHGETR
jgi:hypothetical protein